MSGLNPSNSGVRREQVLVVSDIHLGEDLVEHGPASLLSNVGRLNQEFVSFLAWVETQTAEQPMNLVINGDMFDFVKISLRPDVREAHSRWQQGLSEREERLGLDNTPDKVVWKLERILENHRPLFLALAYFVGHGNRLQIVAGNHDREFYYPEVMDTLSHTLADLYYSHEQTLDCPEARAGFLSRVGFSMWFHLTANGVYIEHGHQYDAYCSFDQLLAPLERSGEIKVALPLSHRAIPYFTDLMGDLSTHNIDLKGPSFYLQALWNMGPRRMFLLLSAYAQVVVAIAAAAGEKKRRARPDIVLKHQAERERLAALYGLSQATAEAIDDGRATPAEFSVFKMVQCFYADRFLLVFGVVTALLLEGWLIKRASLRVSVLGGTLFASYLASRGLARLRRVNLGEELRRAARRVVELIHPRVVVFGHSHRPEALAIGEAWYVNIGSWISRAALLGESTWGMTFAWIDPASGESGLYRWLGPEKGVVKVTALGMLANAPAVSSPATSVMKQSLAR